LNHNNVVYLKEYFEEGNKVRQVVRQHRTDTLVYSCSLFAQQHQGSRYAAALTYVLCWPFSQVYLITELVTGGELLEAVLQRGTYSEAEARLAFVQLLKGIKYLHSKCVCIKQLRSCACAWVGLVQQPQQSKASLCAAFMVPAAAWASLCAQMLIARVCIAHSTGTRVGAAVSANNPSACMGSCNCP
jgi:hypothetical protein